ncbi:MAG: hypothetical protein JHC33_08870 [Ignisphaera sp.]|nr:hypothetical protein [Ignisphaera sp.]
MGIDSNDAPFDWDAIESKPSVATVSSRKEDPLVIEITPPKKNGFVEQVKEGGRELLRNLTPDAIALMFKDGNYFDNYKKLVEEETARVDANAKAVREAPKSDSEVGQAFNNFVSSSKVPNSTEIVDNIFGIGDVGSPKNFAETFGRKLLPFVGESSLLAPLVGANMVRSGVEAIPALAAMQSSGELAATAFGEDARLPAELAGGILSAPLQSATGRGFDKLMDAGGSVVNTVKNAAKGELPDFVKYRTTISPQIDSMIKSAPNGDFVGQLKALDDSIKEIHPSLSLSPASLALVNPSVRSVLENQAKRDPAFLGQLRNQVDNEVDTVIKQIYANEGIPDKEAAIKKFMEITGKLGKDGVDARLQNDPAMLQIKKEEDALNTQLAKLQESLASGTSPEYSVFKGFNAIVDRKLSAVQKKYDPILKEMDVVTPKEVAEIYGAIRAQGMEKTVKSISSSSKDFKTKFEPTLERPTYDSILKGSGSSYPVEKFDSMTPQALHSFQAQVRKEADAAYNRGDMDSYRKAKAVRDKMVEVLERKDPRYADIRREYKEEKQRVGNLYLSDIATRDGWDKRAASLIKDTQAVKSYLSEAESAEDVKPLADAFITSANKAYTESSNPSKALEAFIRTHNQALSAPELADTKAFLIGASKDATALEAKAKEISDAVLARRDAIANDVFSRVYRSNNGLDEHVNHVVKSQEGLDTYLATLNSKIGGVGAQEKAAMEAATQAKLIEMALDKGRDAKSWMSTGNVNNAYDKVFNNSEAATRIARSAETLDTVKDTVEMLEKITPLASSTGKGAFQEYTNIPAAQVFSVMRDRIASEIQKAFILASKYQTGRSMKDIDNELKEVMLDMNKLKRIALARQGALDAQKKIKLDETLKSEAKTIFDKWVKGTQQKAFINPTVGISTFNSENEDRANRTRGEQLRQKGLFSQQ